MRTQNPKPMGHSENSPKREIHSITRLPQETNNKKLSNKKFNFLHKGTRKRTKNKPKVSKRKEIIKVRAEIKK